MSSADGGLAFAYFPATSVVWRASYQSSPFLHPKWGMFQPPAFVRGQGGTTINSDEFYPALQVAPNVRVYYRLIMINQRNGHWMAYLPYWLLTLLFFVPRGGFLAWRVRKQQRLTHADA